MASVIEDIASDEGEPIQAANFNTSNPNTPTPQLLFSTR
jgi:hypothetical protein